MFKRLIVLILVGAVVMAAFPPLRSWSASRAGGVAQRIIGERTGSYPVLDRVLAWSAREEMRQLARGLRETEVAGRPLPSSTEFPRFIAARDPSGREGRDPWGTPYYLSVTSDHIQVSSAGSDRQRGTENDIHVRIPRY